MAFDWLTTLDTRTYGQFTQLSPFVASKPHFTQTLVTHNLKRVLVTDFMGTRRLESENQAKKAFLWVFFRDDFQALAVTDVSDIGGVTFLMDCSLIDLNKEMHSGEVLLCGSLLKH